MTRHIYLAVALALSPAAAFAHGMHHHASQHARLDNSDARVIDSCADMHYTEKVSCLSASRGTNPLQNVDIGGTSGMAAGGSLVAMNGAPASHRVDTKPLTDLEAAAQRLRDAVHALAQTSPGPQRNQAIRDANKTLIEVQSAMAALPPGVVAVAGNESKDKAAMDRLEAAAQRLRDAAHALAQEPVGAKRADSLHTINKALVDTQQVMLDLPRG